jgi:beta-fructofuranosidase
MIVTTTRMALRKVNGKSTSSSNSSQEIQADHIDHNGEPQLAYNRGLSLFIFLNQCSNRVLLVVITLLIMFSILLTYLTLSLSVSPILSQSTTSSAPVPSGTAVAGRYNGMLRPQIHFSPPVGFMNDPNGLFLDAQGIYHMYYQLNPTDTIAGNQHWGHATSPDLYHWTNQPIALFPRANVTGIFTGSCVIDTNNTSGFFPNQTNGVVAIYTGNGENEQNQRIAYSYDDGYTWTQYSNNPVLALADPNFRDPKVIWYAPTQRWIMAVAFATDYTIGIFTSSNLLNWTHTSNFTHYGLLGLQYECPNLVPMPYLSSNGSLISPMYLMYISINPGAPLGGSVGQFFPGSFNGTHFTAVDSAARIADFGKDNYAGQFWYESGESGSDLRGRKSIAWASNWEYCNYVPTGLLEGWQSAMSLPRRNWLENRGRMGWSLISLPTDMGDLIGDEILSNDSFGNGSASATSNTGTGAMMLQLNITNLNASELSNTASCNFTISSSQSGDKLTAGQLFSGTFWLDRGQSGWGTGHTSTTTSTTISTSSSRSNASTDPIFSQNNPFFTDKISESLEITSDYQLLVILDRSIIEIFLNGGVRSATQTFFPRALMDTLTVSCLGLDSAADVSVGAWSLNSAWTSEENGNGVVTGNGTMVRRAWSGDFA